MTCIVGLVHNRAVFLGGDRAGVDGGYNLHIGKAAKVFANGPFVMGYTSSFRLGQILQHSFTPPAPERGADLAAHMATVFVDGLRACLKQGGYATVKDGVDTGGTFLVGVAGRLFQIQDDFHTTEAVCGFDAVGCGAPYAVGSLFTSRSLVWPPHERVRRALRAAHAFSAGVRPPFDVVRAA